MCEQTPGLLQRDGCLLDCSYLAGVSPRRDDNVKADAVAWTGYFAGNVIDDDRIGHRVQCGLVRKYWHGFWRGRHQ